MNPKKQEDDEFQIHMIQMIQNLCQPLDGKEELRIDVHNSKSHPANSMEEPITIFKIHKHLFSEKGHTSKGLEVWEWILQNPEKAKKSMTEQIASHIEEAGQREVIFTDIPDSKLKNSTKLRLREIDQRHLNKSFVFEGIIKSKTTKQIRDKTILWVCNQCNDSYETEITIEQTFNEDKIIEQRRGCMKCFQQTGKPKYYKPIVSKKVGFVIMSVQDENKHGEQEQQTRQVIFDGILSNDGFQKQLITGKKIRILATILHIKSKEKNTVFQIILKAQGIHEETTEEEIQPLSNEELNQLKKESNNSLIKYWATKIYTSLHGYQQIKESIITQMVGLNQIKEGTKRNKSTINILLIGDAGAGKSTFLNLTNQYAIKSRYANASSSSGVGMTASIIKNEITGTNMVDAGAVALASGGILCLDEIDKIHEDELKKLHEAMTENTITINKAGCHETLPANTSILGAGNPKNGIFDTYSDLQQQVTIPITILNRFELIYLIKDKKDEEEDFKKVTKILENHSEQEIEPLELFKKYIKTTEKFNPILSDDIKKKIATFYLKIRKESDAKKIILNTRSIETIINLTKAHAKAELREECLEEDFVWATNTYIQGIGLIATDLISGDIDIQKLETGTSNNERKVSDIILDYLIRENKPVFFTDIRNQISNQVSDREIENLLAKLQRAGEIYEPKQGQWKKA